MAKKAYSKPQPRIHSCSIPSEHRPTVAAAIEADRRRFEGNPSLLEFCRPAVPWELPALRSDAAEGAQVRVTQVRPGVRVRSVVSPAGDAAHRRLLVRLAGVRTPAPERRSARIFRRWKAARSARFERCGR